MPDERPAQTGGRILLSMAVIGVGIAIVAIFTAEWISTTIVPDLGPAEEEVVTAYTPLAFISIAALGAPVVAGILGFFEGRNATSNKHVAAIAVACLAGGVVLMLIAGAGVSVADPTVDEIEDDDEETDDTDADDDDDEVDDTGDPGIVDLIGLAGLVGVGGLIAGGVTAKVSGN